jgi:hypothetical protein
MNHLLYVSSMTHYEFVIHVLLSAVCISLHCYNI